MKNIFLSTLILILSMGLFSSCSKDEAKPNPEDIEVAHGEIDGTVWQYTKAIAKRSGLTSGNLRITLFADANIADLCEHGASAGYIELDVPMEEGKHNIGLITTTVYAYKTPSDDYIQPVSGEINITSITETAVEGTFKTTYEKDGVVKLQVEGKFTSEICGSLEGPSFIDQDLQGTIEDKSDWTCTSASVENNGSSNYNITFNGADADYRIDLKYVPNAVGLYTPGYSNGHFSIDVICPSHPYGKAFAGESNGAVEIVSISETNVIGKVWILDSENNLVDVNGDFTASFAQ